MAVPKKRSGKKITSSSKKRSKQVLSKSKNTKYIKSTNSYSPRGKR